MNLLFLCPKCEQPVQSGDVESARTVRCGRCDWTRDVADDAIRDNRPQKCLVCECADLWRQKDFPVRLGLAMVALGAVLSTIAWGMYEPVWAIGILMAFGLVDLLLFFLMPDVLVCYRCGARHRKSALDDSNPRFDLEIAERYRQEEKRLDEARSPHA